MADTPFIWEWRNQDGIAQWDKDLVLLGLNPFDFTEGTSFAYKNRIAAVDVHNRLFITKSAMADPLTAPKLWRVDTDRSFTQLAVGTPGTEWRQCRLDNHGNPWVTEYEPVALSTSIKGFYASTGAPIATYTLSNPDIPLALATDIEGFAYVALWDLATEYTTIYKVNLSDGTETVGLTLDHHEDVRDMKANGEVGAVGRLYLQTWDSFNAAFRRCRGLRRTDLIQINVFNYPVDLMPQGLDIDATNNVFTWNIGRSPVQDRFYKLTADLNEIIWVMPRTDDKYNGGVSLLDDDSVVACLRQNNRWFYKYDNDLTPTPLASTSLPNPSPFVDMYSSFTSFHQSTHVQAVPFIPLDLAGMTVAEVLASVAVGDAALNIDLVTDLAADVLAKFDVFYPGVIDCANDTTTDALSKMAVFYAG